MINKLKVVACDSVNHTGKLSFRFITDAKTPKEYYTPEILYGLLYRREGTLEINNPFKPRKSKPLTPEIRKRWICNIGRTGQQTFYFHADANDKDEKELSEMLKKIDFECILLVEKNILEPLKIACNTIGMELVVHEFEGTLNTG